MKTQTSKRKFWVRNVLLLPLLAALIYGFSTKEVVERSSNNEKSSTIAQNNDILELRVNDEGTIFLNNKKISLAEIEELDMEKYSDLSIYASPNAPKAVLDALVQIGVSATTVKTVKVRSNGKLPLDIDDVTPGRSPADSMQEKASAEMIKEYNTLAKFYNAQPEDYTVVRVKDFARMNYIFSLMSADQREKAEPFPYNLLPPPPPMPAGSAGSDDAIVPPPPPPPVPETPEEINTDELPSPPPSPEQHFRELAAAGANFFFEGKKISSKEAIEIVDRNKNLRVQVTNPDAEKPTVQIFEQKE